MRSAGFLSTKEEETEFINIQQVFNAERKLNYTWESSQISFGNMNLIFYPKILSYVYRAICLKLCFSLTL